MTSIFSQMYKDKYPEAKISDSFYIGNDINNINLKKLMSGYKDGSIIILQPLSYTDANVLMPMIRSQSSFSLKSG